MDVVYVLVDLAEGDRVEAIHRTWEGAEEHRQRYVMPSWLKVEEWELED